MSSAIRIGAAIAVLLSSQASAREISTTKIGGWDVGAYTNDNGTFSHCVASSVYVDGTVLAFAIDGDQKSWRIGLSNQSWALPVGATYPVAYRVDGDTPSYNTVRIHILVAIFGEDDAIQADEIICSRAGALSTD